MIPDLAPPNWDHLPDRVTCLSLHQPFAGLCAAIDPWMPLGSVGLKSLETRTQAFPKSRPFPAPLVICASHTTNQRAYRAILPRVPAWARPLIDVRGVAMVLVEIGGCRPLTAEDESRSWYWDPDEAAKKITRWAWEIHRADPLYPFDVKGMMGFGQTVAKEVFLRSIRQAFEHRMKERRVTA